MIKTELSHNILPTNLFITNIKEHFLKKYFIRQQWLRWSLSMRFFHERHSLETSRIPFYELRSCQEHMLQKSFSRPLIFNTEGIERLKTCHHCRFAIPIERFFWRHFQKINFINVTVALWKFPDQFLVYTFVVS